MVRRSSAIWFVLLTFLLCVVVADYATTSLRAEELPLKPGEEIVTLNTRPGVSVRVLLSSPVGDPTALFILFSGRAGQLVNRDGQIRYRWVISGLVERGFVVATLDVPSDQGGQGFTDNFKNSDAHVADTIKVIEFLSKKWNKPMFLYSHSRGALSAAQPAIAIKNRKLGGIVLPGSPQRDSSRRTQLSSLTLEKISQPTLFIHHKEDGCHGIDAVRKQCDRIVASPKVTFVEVVGGESSFFADRCGGGTPHCCAGRYDEVITITSDRATGKAVPERIGE